MPGSRPDHPTSAPYTQALSVRIRLNRSTPTDVGNPHTPHWVTSGDSMWTGGITRFGSRPLRHALVEASINVIRESPALSRRFHWILYRGNVQKARVAIARKLAVIIYAILRDRQPFRVQTA